MICETCAVETNATTTELEIPLRKRTVKAANVPAMVCPTCGRVVVEKLIQKVARKAAKRCGEDEFDFAEGFAVYGFAPGLKLTGSKDIKEFSEAMDRLEE